MKYLILYIAFVSSLFLLSCHPEQPRYVIGVSQCSDDEWRHQQNTEMRREAEFYRDLQVIIRTAKDDSKQQMRDIRRFLDEGVDLLVVSPNEAEPITPVVEEAYDRGIESVLDAQGRRYRAAITDYDWYLGLAVSNPASVVRIANIDVTQLKNDATSGANLIDLLIDAKERLGDDVVGRTAFYANGDITRVLRHQIVNKTNSQLTWETVAGRKVSVFDDTPIHKMPAGVLLSTEARVI